SQPKEIQIHQLREQLQLLLLKIISDKKYFKNIAFLGGTALRICHNLQRYSEDLDFSLIENKGYDFLDILHKITKELEHYGLQTDIKYKTGTVDNAYIRFPNILQQAGLTDISSQKLSIKLEIDTNPPQGYSVEKQLINNTFIFPLLVFDLPSLFAGKLHAILYRKFIKGRDRYDLVRYLSNRIIPNFTLLQYSEKQTGITSLTTNTQELKQKILNKLKTTSKKTLLNDVGVFLMHPSERELLSLENIKNLVEKTVSS
ncbi:MAG: hypothetical protein CR971_01555, partial [candidate division SR1 bacterium]